MPTCREKLIKKMQADPNADLEWSWGKILDHSRKAMEKHVPLDDPRAKEWLDARPPQVREMVLSHPDHLVYRVKDGAPYSGTHAGCVGIIMAYTEKTEGKPGWFSIKFGMLRAAGSGLYIPIYAHIDPEWLEPVPMEEIEKNARLETN